MINAYVLMLICHSLGSFWYDLKLPAPCVSSTLHPGANDLSCWSAVNQLTHPVIASVMRDVFCLQPPVELPPVKILNVATPNSRSTRPNMELASQLVRYSLRHPTSVLHDFTSNKFVTHGYFLFCHWLFYWRTISNNKFSCVSFLHTFMAESGE